MPYKAWPSPEDSQNAMSNCLVALGPHISPMTIALLTDLGFSIPLSFIDKCVATSVDSTIYWQYTFETFHLPPLFESDSEHKSLET